MNDLWIILLVLAGLVVLIFLLLGPGQTWWNEHRYPARGRFVELPEYGVRMHYVEAGPVDGPVVVCVHGMFASHYDYTLGDFWEEAKARYRLIAIDRPGKGYSTRPAGMSVDAFTDAKCLQQFMEKLELDQPIIVAHSNGSPTALAHALNYPDVASGYILLGPAAHPAPPYPLQGEFLYRFCSLIASRISGPVLSRLTLQIPAWFGKGAATRHVFYPERPSPAFARYAGALTRRPSQIQNEARDILTIPTTLAAIVARLDEIKAAVHVIAADADTMAPLETHAQPLAEALPNATLEVIGEAGHMIQILHGRRILQRLDQMSNCSTDEMPHD